MYNSIPPNIYNGSCYRCAALPPRPNVENIIKAEASPPLCGWRLSCRPLNYAPTDPWQFTIGVRVDRGCKLAIASKIYAQTNKIPRPKPIFPGCKWSLRLRYRKYNDFLCSRDRLILKWYCPYHSICGFSTIRRSPKVDVDRYPTSIGGCDHAKCSTANNVAKAAYGWDNSLTIISSHHNEGCISLLLILTLFHFSLLVPLGALGTVR